MGTQRKRAGDPSASTDRDNITLWKTDGQRKTMRVRWEHHRASGPSGVRVHGIAGMRRGSEGSVVHGELWGKVSRMAVEVSGVGRIRRLQEVIR